MVVTDEMVNAALIVAAKYKIQGADATSIKAMLQAAYRVGLLAKGRIKVRIRDDNKGGVIVGGDGKSGLFRVEFEDGKQLMMSGNELLADF
jgi:hypothetical protein